MSNSKSLDVIVANLEHLEKKIDDYKNSTTSSLDEIKDSIKRIEDKYVLKESFDSQVLSIKKDIEQGDELTRNEFKDTKKVVWTTLFIVVSAFTGFIFFIIETFANGKL